MNRLPLRLRKAPLSSAAAVGRPDIGLPVSFGVAARRRRPIGLQIFQNRPIYAASRMRQLRKSSSAATQPSLGCAELRLGRRVTVREGCLAVGITSNVRDRLEWHNHGPCGHTTRYRPWSLIVSMEFPTEAEAVRFEKYLKSGSGRAFTKRHLPPTDEPHRTSAR